MKAEYVIAYLIAGVAVALIQRAAQGPVYVWGHILTVAVWPIAVGTYCWLWLKSHRRALLEAKL